MFRLIRAKFVRPSAPNSLPYRYHCVAICPFIRVETSVQLPSNCIPAAYERFGRFREILTFSAFFHALCDMHAWFSHGFCAMCRTCVVHSDHLNVNNGIPWAMDASFPPPASDRVDGEMNLTRHVRAIVHFPAALAAAAGRRGRHYLTGRGYG